MACDDECSATLPLNEAIIEARTRMREQEKQNPQSGPFRTRLFDFVRDLRGHPDLKSLSAREVLTSICAAVERYAGHGADPWVDFLEFSEEEKAEFLVTWGKVNFPAGIDHLGDAVADAKTNPLVIDNGCSTRKSNYEFFVSIAGHLQARVGPHLNILLPCKKLSEILKVNASTVSYYRQLAVIDGYLEEIVPYRPPATGTGRATEFRFRLDRFPELQEVKSTETNEVKEEAEEL